MARLERTGGLCDDAPMRHRIHAIAIPSEVGEFADEVRRIFLELGRAFGREFLSGECTPPVDVYETDEAVEIVVDVPGIDASAVRLIAKSETLLIVGSRSESASFPYGFFKDWTLDINTARFTSN